MREYFREERVRLKYHPYLLILRLLFLGLVLLSGLTRGWVLISAAVFSVGLWNKTEEEYLLPLEDKAMIGRKRMRVNMVALRYLLFTALGYAFDFFMQQEEFLWRRSYLLMTQAPLLMASYLILMMVVIYSTLLEMMIGFREKKKILPKGKRILLETIPLLMFFITSFRIMAQKEWGNRYLYAAVLFTAAVLNVIAIMQTLRGWKMGDYTLEMTEGEAKG